MQINLQPNAFKTCPEFFLAPICRQIFLYGFQISTEFVLFLQCFQIRTKFFVILRCCFDFVVGLEPQTDILSTSGIKSLKSPTNQPRTQPL